MSTIDTQLTIGQMLRERPALSRVFERFGIDYCCGGRKSLEEACAETGQDLATVVRHLEQADGRSEPADTPDFGTMPLSALIDHVLQTHHVYLRNELPRLLGLTRKIAGVHGQKEPRLHEVAEVMAGLVEELEGHMMKEEQVLFPAILEMEATGARPHTCFGSFANPIAMMEYEHDSAGQALTRFRELTDGLTPPAWACNTYRATLDGIAGLEADLHQHIHKENNILFPRAIEMEQRLLGQ